LIGCTDVDDVVASSAVPITKRLLVVAAVVTIPLLVAIILSPIDTLAWLAGNMRVAIWPGISAQIPTFTPDWLSPVTGFLDVVNVYPSGISVEADASFILPVEPSRVTIRPA